MGNEYMQYPSTVKVLAEELIKVCDDYYARKINNDRVREIILCYANNRAHLLFDAENLNPTITKIIGKKRVGLINEIIRDAGQNGGN